MSIERVPRLAERLKALRLGPSLTYADDMGSPTSAPTLLAGEAA